MTELQLVVLQDVEPAMKRICYMSRAKSALTDVQRDMILTVSLRNNIRSDITGLLLCDGQRFLQAIEDEDAAIERCFGRISTDDRHTDISVLENADITNRQFGSWALTCRSSLYLLAADFRESVAADVEHVSNIRLKAMFIGFAGLVR